MEKHHSRTSAKRVPPVVDDSFSLPPLGVGSDNAPPVAATSDKKESTVNKPSREDVSRCINIWASVYLGRNTPADAGDLRLPSRPWLGRSPNSMKRFE